MESWLAISLVTVLGLAFSLGLYMLQLRRTRLKLAQLAGRADCHDEDFCANLKCTEVVIALIIRDSIAATCSINPKKIYPSDPMHLYGEIEMITFGNELERRELPMHIMNVTHDPNRDSDWTIMQYIKDLIAKSSYK